MIQITNLFWHTLLHQYTQKAQYLNKYSLASYI